MNKILIITHIPGRRGTYLALEEKEISTITVIARFQSDEMADLFLSLAKGGIKHNKE